MLTEKDRESHHMQVAQCSAAATIKGYCGFCHADSSRVFSFALRCPTVKSTAFPTMQNWGKGRHETDFGRRYFARFRRRVRNVFASFRATARAISPHHGKLWCTRFKRRRQPSTRCRLARATHRGGSTRTQRRQKHCVRKHLPRLRALPHRREKRFGIPFAGLTSVVLVLLQRESVRLSSLQER